MLSHVTIRPLPGVLEIAPYIGGSARIATNTRAIKLSSNENPHGPSPKAREAYRAAAGELNLYPEAHEPLARAIAEVHHIEPERIVLGNGSDELIALLCKAYAGQGDEVLYSAHGFLMYRVSALAAGATPVSVPERNLTADVDALIAAMTERTRLVFLANPNNPTGTTLPGAEIMRLAIALPPHAILVLDAAYSEYLRQGDNDGCLLLVRERENVVMTRTFSKIYGLAALRLGWCYAPEHIVDVLNRVRGPFNVTRPALAAGEAAMRDQEWVDTCRGLNEVWRDWLAREIMAAGLSVTPSKANFLLVGVGDHTDAFDAHLQSRCLIARRVDGYGLPNYIRITVGDEAACRAVAEAVTAFARGSLTSSRMRYVP